MGAAPNLNVTTNDAEPDRSVAERISCADSAFPRLSHEVALRVIADLGIPAVDVCVFEGYRHNPPKRVAADPARAADAVLRRLDRTGLVVADVFAILGDPLLLSALAVNHPERSVREASWSLFHPILEFARRIGSPGITLLPGSIFEGVDPETGLELAAAELQRRAEIAGQAGLELSIEPHYRSVVETPERAMGLLEKAPEVTLTLDHGHFVFQGFTQDEIDVLIPRARHLQLRQAAPGDMQRPARSGAIDYALLLDRLSAAGYRGYLGLEYQWDEWMDFNRVDCVSETAELRDVLIEHARAATAAVAASSEASS